VLLSSLTGTGCMTNAVIAAFAAGKIIRLDKLIQIVEQDPFVATVGGLAAFEVAAEIAMSRGRVDGPASFKSILFDSLYNLTPHQLYSRVNVKIETVK